MPYKDIAKQKLAQQRYYKERKEDIKRRTRDGRSFNKKFLEEYKAGKTCADCGIDYPAHILEFDHVRGEKIGNLSRMIHSHGIEAIKAEIEKCEIVCANCHRHRTWKRQIGPKKQNS